MAVVDFVTVQHLPFPTRIQRRSLEPDGIAIFAVRTTGNGSGGNVLVTVRSDTAEFFYLLKSWNIRVASASTPGEFVFVFNPEWLEDVNSSPTAFNVEASMPVRAHGSNFRIGSAGSAEVLRIAELVPLGKVAPLVGATQDLVLFNYETNVNTSTYDSVGMFWVYRKEALTVPGFLESLRNPLVVR